MEKTVFNTFCFVFCFRKVSPSVPEKELFRRERYVLSLAAMKECEFSISQLLSPLLTRNALKIESLIW